MVASEAVERRETSPLLASAYDFVEHSLENAHYAEEGEPRRWKFAIIAIATSVELFLKERLRREHPILIFSKVDDGTGHTVNLDVALKRLRTCNVELDPEDVTRLNRARDVRNSIIHFNTQATPEQLRATYVDFLEFAHVFHERELGAELHDHVGEDYWDPEARFMEHFRREFVTYHGDTLHREFPSLLVEYQYLTHIFVDGESFARIPYGDPREGGSSPSPKTCHDCAALVGQLHGPGCDWERCPRCLGQALICECGGDGGVELGPVEE